MPGGIKEVERDRYQGKTERSVLRISLPLIGLNMTDRKWCDAGKFV